MEDINKCEKCSNREREGKYLFGRGMEWIQIKRGFHSVYLSLVQFHYWKSFGILEHRQYATVIYLCLEQDEIEKQRVSESRLWNSRVFFLFCRL
jgi:hypothetical protein